MKTVHYIRTSPKSWPEDYQQENGNYVNKCCHCNEPFMGNKNRIVCKECATINTK